MRIPPLSPVALGVAGGLTLAALVAGAGAAVARRRRLADLRRQLMSSGDL